MKLGDTMTRVIFSRISDNYFVKSDVITKIEGDRIYLSKGTILTREQDDFKEAKYKYWKLKN